MKRPHGPRHVTENAREPSNPVRIESRLATIRGSARPLENSAGSELLTAKDLEALLKIDVKTIYSYVERGLIPYVRIQSNVRFVERQIHDWVAEHTYRPRPVNGNGVKRRVQ